MAASPFQRKLLGDSGGDPGRRTLVTRWMSTAGPSRVRSPRLSAIGIRPGNSEKRIAERFQRSATEGVSEDVALSRSPRHEVDDARPRPVQGCQEVLFARGTDVLHTA